MAISPLIGKGRRGSRKQGNGRDLIQDVRQKLASKLDSDHTWVSSSRSHHKEAHLPLPGEYINSIRPSKTHKHNGIVTRTIGSKTYRLPKLSKAGPFNSFCTPLWFGFSRSLKWDQFTRSRVNIPDHLMMQFTKTSVNSQNGPGC